MTLTYQVQVQYMVDMTAQRHVLQLGSTEVQDYPVGKSTMHFSASAIDISGLKRSWLNNVGLLLVTHSCSGQLVDPNMHGVTHLIPCSK